MKKQFVIIGIAVILVAVGLSGCNKQTNTQTNNQISNNTEPPTDTKICYYDWITETTDHIGNYYSSLDEYQYEAKPGYIFSIVTFKIFNQAIQSVSTNPWNWEMIVNSVSYSHHTATYDNEIGHTTVDIGKGGYFETKIVFEIPKSTTTGTLVYTGLYGPKMERDDTLITELPPPPDYSSSIEIIDSNYYMYVGFAHFFGVAKNTYTKSVSFIKISFTLYNENNNVIDTEWTYANKLVVKSGDTTTFDLLHEGSFHHYTITVVSASDSFWEPYQDLIIQDHILNEASEYISGSITGNIKNTGTKYLEFVDISAILYDSSGKMIGINTDNVMYLDAGQSETFEIYLFDQDRMPDTTVASYKLEVFDTSLPS